MHVPLPECAWHEPTSLPVPWQTWMGGWGMDVALWARTCVQKVHPLVWLHQREVVGEVQEIRCNLGMELGFKTPSALSQRACSLSSCLRVLWGQWALKTNKKRPDYKYIFVYKYKNLRFGEGLCFSSYPLAPRRESEPELHEQHWFWIGLNRRDPTGDRSWRWSDGLGVSLGGFGKITPVGIWGAGGANPALVEMPNTAHLSRPPVFLPQL